MQRLNGHHNVSFEEEVTRMELETLPVYSTKHLLGKVALRVVILGNCFTCKCHPCRVCWGEKTVFF